MSEHPQDQQYYRTVRKIRRIVGRLLLALAAIAVAIQVWTWWQKVPRNAEPLPHYTRAKGRDSLRFMVVGDTGSGNANQFAVAAAMQEKCAERRPDGIIMLGDNFIQVGVSSADDPQWDQKIMEPYGTGCLEMVPIYAALGNHDYKGSIEAQIRPPTPDDKWFMPHRYYQVTFGALLNLVVTDTNMFDICFDESSCVMDFMARALDKTRYPQPWTLVASHHPITTSSGKYRKKEPVGWFHQKLICGKAHGLLSGHSHHLEHMRIEDCDLDQIVAGGGGSFLYPIIPGKEGSKFAVSRYGYVVLDVTARQLRYEYFDSNNKSLYTHTLTKP